MALRAVARAARAESASRDAASLARAHGRCCVQGDVELATVATLALNSIRDQANALGSTLGVGAEAAHLEAIIDNPS